MSIAIILAAASSAATVQPTFVRFGRPDNGSIEHLSIVARDRASHAHVTVTFELATTRPNMQEMVVPLAVSRDVEITGLSIAFGNRVARAFSDTAHDARESYRQMVETVRDPALLEWTDANQLALRAFPITKDSPATITIDLELRHDATLVLDPGRRAFADVAVDLGTPTTWVTFDKPRKLALADTPHDTVYEFSNERLRVDRRHSLVALPELNRPAHDESAEDRQFQDDLIRWSRDDFHLVDVAAAHGTALGHCYALGRELDPTISSRVEIVVRLAPNAVPQVGVGGIDIAEVNACLVDEIASWNFPAVTRSMTLRTGASLANYQLVTTSPKL